MPAFTTLADLVAANADLQIRCGGQYCRSSTIQPYRFLKDYWSEQERAQMGSMLIADEVKRLKCKKCGGRVKEWWPQVRMHGDMATW